MGISTAIGIGIQFSRGGGQDWESYWATRTPSGLAITIDSTTQNTLNWTINGTGYDGFSIERSDDGGAFFEIGTVLGNIDTYIDDELPLGILYTYHVRAYKDTHYSPFTSTVNNLSGDIATGLVGQWLFNEGTGATATDTGGANNGAIVGAEWETGKISYGLKFDGVSGNDSVKLGDVLDTTFAGANKKFSIACWIKPASVMTDHYLVGKYSTGVTGQREFVFSISTDSRLRFLWYGALAGTTARGYIGTLPITDTNKWYHVVVTYDGTLTLNDRVAFYIDAVSDTMSVSVSTGTPAAIVDGTSVLTIGAHTQVDDSTLKNFDGIIDSVNIFDKVLTYADILSLKYVSYPAPGSYPVLYNYDAGAQDDVFLDTTYEDSKSGIEAFVKKPVRYSGNPVFVTGTNSDTWDYDKHYPCVLYIGGTYYMWYSAVPFAGVPPYLLAYATSTDGITWTKPNLGIVTYGGNTNNNLIIGLGACGINVYYNPEGSADMRYMATLANNPDGGVGDWETDRTVTIYKSADGITWTSIKELEPAGSPYLEAAGIIKRDDDKWIAYYIWYGLVDTRRVGAYLSDTTDPTGTWTDQGTVLNTMVSNDQKYSNFNVELIDGLYYAKVNNYNSVTGLIFVDLYVSRDGLVWTKKMSQWLPLGASGAWDDSMLLCGNTFNKISNDWRLYYAGIPLDHSIPSPRDARIGYATIGYKRIGYLTGSGTYVTTAFTPTDKLYLNADLRKGTLQVELLDASDDSVLAGYSKTDMDALTTEDTYSKEVTWGGNSIREDISLKIKFYFS